MIGLMRRGVALATAAGVLGLAGSALAAGTASAAQYNLTYGVSGGKAVSPAASFTATSSNISFRTSSGGLVSSCTSSTLSGTTDPIVTGGPQAGLSVTSATFSGCKVTATNVALTVTVPSASLPWQVTPTSGTSSPFTGKITSNGSSGLIQVNVACSSGSTTFSASSLTGTETNGSGSTASSVSLSGAGPMSTTTSACALPLSVYVTGSYSLATVNGASVTNGSTGNDLILNYS